MRVQWKKLLLKTVIWAIAEILLNFLGLDKLADYSEFVFEKNLVHQEQLFISIGDLGMVTPINRHVNSHQEQQAASTKAKILQIPSRRKIHHRHFIAARSFGEKFNIYTGEKIHGLQVILRLAGTVIPGVFPWVCFCGIYGTAIALVHHLGWLSSISENKGIANFVIGLNLALSLLLVFRTNTAHERFWEGRKLWGAMVNVVRNAVRGIWLYVEEVEPQDRQQKQATMRLVSAFAVAMKFHLRRDPIESELEPLMSAQQYNRLQHTNHPPLDLALWIGDYLQRRYEQNQLNVFQLTDLQKCIDEMVDILGGCERILKTPVPLVYTIALKTLFVVYFVISPLGMVDGLGWFTGLVLAFIGFIFLAINEVGAEIEEPFGHDPNDLPLDFICDTIKRNVEDLIQYAPNSQQIINLPRKAA